MTVGERQPGFGVSEDGALSECTIAERDRKLSAAFRRREGLPWEETIGWLTPERFALMSPEARAVLPAQVRRRLTLALALER